MTQWPVPGNAPMNQGTPGFSTPALGNITSAFANTALETWDQTRIQTGCMNCHNSARNNDFLWSLEMNAFAAATPQNSLVPNPQPRAIRELRALLREQFQ
jgi:hypothetical protein